jgi:hypothetical protein
MAIAGEFPGARKGARAGDRDRAEQLHPERHVRPMFTIAILAVTQSA